MFAPLGVRNFRLLFTGMVVGQALMPLQFIAQIIWVQESAGADVRIVLVGLIESLHYVERATRDLQAGFALVGGVDAQHDRIERILAFFNVPALMRCEQH